MIRIYKTKEGIILEHNGEFFRSSELEWDRCINQNSLYQVLLQEISRGTSLIKDNYIYGENLLPPIGSQEVWAAGVTYLRSKVARMEESEESGSASFYDKVYEAERPELFFKSTASRVVGTHNKVRIRKDSGWNVPEPELILVVNKSAQIVAYSIGNDMSSRSIEGENPLYLPQAKIYDGSAAVGPCLLVTPDPIPSTTGISMTVQRNSQLMFEGSTTIDKMKRTHTELVSYLYRECSFPQGCYLMTGTCVVPGGEFSLQSGDSISITIEHIGTLENTVA
jgi:2-dehydro-3-deoxy-D-arabinonate dehydratase